jgi:hypothetical protein
MCDRNSTSPSPTITISPTKTMPNDHRSDHRSDHHSDQHSWHQKPIVRVILLLLLPLIIGGLYLISTQFVLTRPTTIPEESGAVD